MKTLTAKFRGLQFSPYQYREIPNEHNYVWKGEDEQGNHREIELQFLAVCLNELVTGFDLDPEVWPHPFTPELLVLSLQRARARTGHLTRSSTEPDWHVRIVRFFKLFSAENMLPRCNPVARKSQQALQILRRHGFHHFTVLSLLDNKPRLGKRAIAEARELGEPATLGLVIPFAFAIIP
jgi:hypothetical protein